MKKNLQAVIIFSMIFLSSNVFGQTITVSPEQTKIHKNSSNTYFDLLLNLVGTNLNYGKSNTALRDYKKAVLGAQVGMSFQAGLTPQLSVVSEFYFMMKGGELKANNPLTTNKTTLRLYTLELPVLVRYNVGKFYLNAGPSIAYNLMGDKKIDDVSKSVSFNDATDNFKRWDAGIQMGAGYRFKIRQKSVVLDARYSYGLTNISYGQEMYNRNLNVSLHFSKAWKTNPIGLYKNL
jgi:hypothetical protein